MPCFRPQYNASQLKSDSQLNDKELKIFEKAIKGNSLFHKSNSSFRSIMQQRTYSLLGLRVRTDHRQNVIREYRVNGVRKSAASTTFIREDNVEESVAAYFERRYRTLQLPRMPVLHIGSKKRAIYMPIEVRFCVRASCLKFDMSLWYSFLALLLGISATSSEAVVRQSIIENDQGECFTDKPSYCGISKYMKCISLLGFGHSCSATKGKNLFDDSRCELRKVSRTFVLWSEYVEDTNTVFLVIHG